MSKLGPAGCKAQAGLCSHCPRPAIASCGHRSCCVRLFNSTSLVHTPAPAHYGSLLEAQGTIPPGVRTPRAPLGRCERAGAHTEQQVKTCPCDSIFHTGLRCTERCVCLRSSRLGNVWQIFAMFVDSSLSFVCRTRDRPLADQGRDAAGCDQRGELILLRRLRVLQMLRDGEAAERRIDVAGLIPA